MEDFFRSVIWFAHPHTVGAIVVIAPFENELAPTSFLVPIVVVPVWQVVAPFREK